MADINRINELVGQQEFEEAKTLIDIALSETPDDRELLKLAGLTEVNLENWELAKKYFETVVKFENQDATSWFYLASCYEKLGDLISAKNAYIKVIELRPEYMDAYQSLCVILIKNNDLQDAIDYANKATELEPENYIYNFIAGTAYMKNKDFDKAIAPLSKALEKAPSNLGTLNSLGTCYMATGNANLAIKTYKQALEINPKNPMAYFNIGSAYQIQQITKKL